MIPALSQNLEASTLPTKPLGFLLHWYLKKDTFVLTTEYFEHLIIYTAYNWMGFCTQPTQPHSCGKLQTVIRLPNVQNQEADFLKHRIFERSI